MTARRHSIGIDLGTSSLKAALFDGALRVVASRTLPLRTHSDGDDGSTQRIAEVRRALARALAELARHRAIRSVGCLGLTTHRSSLVEWDPARRKFGSTITLWNDRRAQGLVDSLRERGRESAITRRTGLPLLPFFFGPRAAALRDHGALELGSRLLTMDAALLLLLGTERPTTDPSYAARTLLANRLGEYDSTLLRTFAVDRGRLAPVVDSIGERGVIAGDLVPASLRGVPITAALADQSAACLGLSALAPRRTTLVLGTGTFAARAGANEDTGRGVFPLVLARERARVLAGVEANDPSTGASFAAIRELLGVATDRALESLARRAKSPALVIPAATGLGAPWLRPDATLSIRGVTPTTTRADVAAGLFEGVAARAAELLATIGGPGEVRTGGGGAASDLLLRRIADRSGRSIARSAEPNAGALGVAACARIGIGESWKSVARLVAARTAATRVFVPSTTSAQRARLRAAFEAAIDETR